MDTVGRHTLIELHGCDALLLDDPAHVERLMREAAAAAGVTIVNASFHRFAPQGVTGLLAIEESHFSVHTWPERAYAAIDYYTCGVDASEVARHVMMAGLAATRMEVMVVGRGAPLPGPTIQVLEHSSVTAEAPDSPGPTPAESPPTS